jgi:hypothetical protein
LAAGRQHSIRRSAIGVLLGAFVSTVRRRGVRHAAAQSFRYVAGVPRRRAMHRRERAFDREHGVDTAGIVPLSRLAFASPNKGHGVRYEATDPSVFRDLVSQLSIPLDEFTFVDYGAGKGRVLLLAAGMPFKRIVGVEFSPELAEVARRNLETFRGPMTCSSIEVVCCDAAELEPPEGPLVLFFFNPFAEPVLRVVLDRVVRSLAADPRPAFALVTGAVSSASLFAAAGFSEMAGTAPRSGRVLVAGAPSSS